MPRYKAIIHVTIPVEIEFESLEEEEYDTARELFDDLSDEEYWRLLKLYNHESDEGIIEVFENKGSNHE